MKTKKEKKVLNMQALSRSEHESYHENNKDIRKEIIKQQREEFKKMLEELKEELIEYGYDRFGHFGVIPKIDKLLKDL